MNITCLGDSICYGYGVRTEDAWVTLVGKELEDVIPGSRVINAGVNGETAGEGLHRLSSLLSPAPEVLYVQFGLNDAAMGEPVQRYLDNMHEITHQALAKGTGCVLVATNHPVAPEEYFPGGSTYRQAAQYFNGELRKQFENAEWPIRFVDVERMCEALGDVHTQVRMLQDDGDHLSLEGNRIYCRLITPIVRECLAALA